MTHNPFVLVLLRRDLRLEDNPALYFASQTKLPLLILYVFDKHSALGPPQVWWLEKSLSELPVWIKVGDTITILEEVIEKLSPSEIFINRGTTRDEAALDEEIKKIGTTNKIPIQFHAPNYLIQFDQLMTKKGTPIKVFSHFANTYLKEITFNEPLPKPKLIFYPHPLKSDSFPVSSDSLSSYWAPGEEAAKKVFDEFSYHHLAHYERDRDFPYLNATSHLSPYLHFGEISIRTIVYELKTHLSCRNIKKFLFELLWREFATYLLLHYPSLIELPFDPHFKKFHWNDNSHTFHLWQSGRTGVPIVDAAMICLNQTGFLHNRLRMIVASFLTKDLLIDWRLGAKYFEETLVDADLASNRINWQWVSGCGIDAAPYFRIFNPYLQSKKFDPHGDFIKTYLPKLHHLNAKEIHAPHLLSEERLERAHIVLGKTYPKPIVDHERARKIALARFQNLKTAT